MSASASAPVSLALLAYSLAFSVSWIALHRPEFSDEERVADSELSKVAVEDKPIASASNAKAFGKHAFVEDPHVVVALHERMVKPYAIHQHIQQPHHRE